MANDKFFKFGEDLIWRIEKIAKFSGDFFYKDIRSFFGNAATRQVKSVTKKRVEVETICID